MKHISVAVSYGFGSDNRYNDTGTMPKSIQLALYKYELYEQQKKEIFKAVSRSHTHVHVVHMPFDFLRHESQLMFDMMKELRDEIGCCQFVVHPNKNIKQFLSTFLEADGMLDLTLCIENFQFRKKKELRNPLKAIEFINKLKETHEDVDRRLRLCFDTSHADDIWFEYQLMYFILPYTNVIHLSNREGRNQHLPFNTEKGDLNLVGFVKDLKKRYDWSGTIVLEYMPEHRHKLYQNAEYIKRLLYGDSKHTV
jgi:sugar phosphate isomerase/epimerase